MNLKFYNKYLLQINYISINCNYNEKNLNLLE